MENNGSMFVFVVNKSWPVVSTHCTLSSARTNIPPQPSTNCGVKVELFPPRLNVERNPKKIIENIQRHFPVLHASNHVGDCLEVFCLYVDVHLTRDSQNCKWRGIFLHLIPVLVRVYSKGEVRSLHSIVNLDIKHPLLCCRFNISH